MFGFTANLAVCPTDDKLQPPSSTAPEMGRGTIYELLGCGEKIGVSVVSQFFCSSSQDMQLTGDFPHQRCQHAEYEKISNI